MSAISSRMVFQLLPPVYVTFPSETFISPIEMRRSSIGLSLGSVDSTSGAGCAGDAREDISDGSSGRCSGDCDESVFEGGEFVECRTCEAKSVTSDSNRCIRCCRNSLEPGFAEARGFCCVVRGSENLHWSAVPLWTHAKHGSLRSHLSQSQTVVLLNG